MLLLPIARLSLSCADQPPLGFKDIEVVVSARPICLQLQVCLQFQQLTLQIKFKIAHRAAVTLAAPRQPVGPVQVFEIINLREKILLAT